MKSKLMPMLIILLFAFAPCVIAASSSAVGLWKTIDDKTGKPRSLIRVTENNGEYSATIEKGLRESDTGDAVCDKCTDERKGQRIIGMTIATGLKEKSGVYEGGKILDPENGKTYRCKLKLNETGNQLEVRGFIGLSLFGRSQIWMREE